MILGNLTADVIKVGQLKFDFPSLIYCSLKGFLQGPYEYRETLDEVVQMMDRLACMAVHYVLGPALSILWRNVWSDYYSSSA